MKRRVMLVPTPSPPYKCREFWLSDFVKVAALADSLVAEFWLMNFPAESEFNEAMRAYEYAPAVKRN
jgi:hypothetical protein